MSVTKQIRVLVVDDSLFAREAIQSILEEDPQMLVVGFAENGIDAIQKTKDLKPDVITMDLSMPKMSGPECIKEIMQHYPTPIIIVSRLEIKEIVACLGLGAMDFVAVRDDMDALSAELREKVRLASRIKPLRQFKVASKLPKAAKKVRSLQDQRVVAIGVSTGGPQALLAVLSKLPADFPAPVLVVQHMSKGFIHGLAEWLRQYTALRVCVAEQGDTLTPGTIYFAPDNAHLTVTELGTIALKDDGENATLHVPSADVLLKSVADIYGVNAIGVIMTGMGRDGADGIKAIYSAGGTTIAQDEATSVIYGMNKIAVDMGCVSRVVPLDKIADELIKSGG